MNRTLPASKVGICNPGRANRRRHVKQMHPGPHPQIIATESIATYCTAMLYESISRIPFAEFPSRAVWKQTYVS